MEREMYEASLKEKLSDSVLLRVVENRQFEKWDYENVLASARSESRLEGKLEGKLEGAEQKSYEVVSNLILETDFEDKKIASLAVVSVDFVKKVRADLLHKKK